MTEVRILFVFLQQKREDLAEMAQISGIQKAFIQLHLSVMLAGFTGLFGKLITLNEVDIVWYRMLFTSIILLVFTGLPQIERKKLLQLGGCGALLGLHWMLFYGSIKASNVSIGVICYSLVGFFTAIIEPIIYRKKISTIEILFSLITVLGLLCIFSFDARLVIFCCCLIWRLQQEGQCRSENTHSVILPDECRISGRQYDYTVLPDDVPCASGCARYS